MTDDQGALNHLLHGEVGTAVHDVVVSTENFFTTTIDPALLAFIKQFASDFGSQALTAAAPLALQVIAGTTTIQAAGATLATQLSADALTDAEKDGTVALNALRVQITAAQVVPVVTPSPVAS